MIRTGRITKLIDRIRPQRRHYQLADGSASFSGARIRSGNQLSWAGREKERLELLQMLCASTGNESRGSMGAAESASALLEQGEILRAADQIALALWTDHSDENVRQLASRICAALQERGLTAYQAGDLGTAQTHFEKLLALNEDNEAARSTLTAIYEKRERIALKQQRLAEPKAAYSRGFALIDSGRVREALGIFLSTLKKEPENEEALRGRSVCVEKLLEQAKEKERMGDSAGALADIKFALEAKPDDPRVERIVVKAQRRTGQASEENWLARGKSLFEAGDIAGAISWYEGVLRNSPESSVPRELLARCYMKLGEYQKAIVYLKENIERFPKHSSSLGLLYDCFMRLGETEELLCYLEKLFERASDNFSVVFFLGKFHVTFGQNQQAVGYFKRAIEIAPRDKTSRVYLGNCYKEMELFDQALATFREIFKLYPRDYFVWLGIGECYLRLDQVAMARPCFVKVLKGDPYNEEALYGLSRVYYAGENYQRALEMIERAISNAESPDVSSINQKGNVLRKLGRINQAIVEHREVLRIVGEANVLSIKYLKEEIDATIGLAFCSLALGDKAIEARQRNQGIYYYEEAQEHFRQALIGAEQRGVKKARIYWGIGFVHLSFYHLQLENEGKREQLHLALEAFNRALAIDPGNSHASSGRGKVLAFLQLHGDHH